MPSKNHQQLDRIILFEIGVIIALLFVNYTLNIPYQGPIPTPVDEENILEDQPFQLTIVEEKKTDQPSPKLEKKELANVFDPRSLIKQVDDLFNLKKTKITPPTIPFLGGINPIVVKPIVDSSTIVRDWADEMPSFPGGEEALNKFIIDEFDIPEIVQEIANDVEVVVQFVVNETGNVENIQILRCSKPGFGIEKEAISIYQNMPRWTPGKSKGDPVKVRVKQPIKIQIR